MSEILLCNLALLDPHAGELLSGYEVLLRDKEIVAVEKGTIHAPGAEVHDLGGRTLMPGLIDCHVHLNRTILPTAPLMLPSLLTAHAGATLKGMLMRGFTTVRDAGGVDAGHRQAVEMGLFTGPRLFVSGRALSQTGGHGDPDPHRQEPVEGRQLGRRGSHEELPAAVSGSSSAMRSSTRALIWSRIGRTDSTPLPAGSSSTQSR